MPRIHVSTMNGTSYYLSSLDPELCAKWLWEMTQRMGIESDWGQGTEFRVQISPLWIPNRDNSETYDWPASHLEVCPVAKTPLEAGRQVIKWFGQLLDEQEKSDDPGRG